MRSKKALKLTGLLFSMYFVALVPIGKPRWRSCFCSLTKIILTSFASVNPLIAIYFFKDTLHPINPKTQLKNYFRVEKRHNG